MAAATTSTLTTSPASRVSHLFSGVLRSPAAWFYAIVWLLSAGYLALNGGGDLILFGAIWLAAAAVFGTITVLATVDAPEDREYLPRERARLWVQLAIIVVFVLLTAYGGLRFHSVVPADSEIPLWTPMTLWLEQLGGQWFGNDNYLVNPVTYLVIPLILLLGTGASFAGLGFGRGHRVGRVLLIWALIPVLYIAAQVATGALASGILLSRLISNFMQNGLFEEFLFRGALQTRLRRLFNAEWALVLQALAFGVWHLGLGFTNVGSGDLLAAAASTILLQGGIGLCLGIIFARSRNLLVPSVFHILLNSMGI